MAIRRPRRSSFRRRPESMLRPVIPTLRLGPGLRRDDGSVFTHATAVSNRASCTTGTSAITLQPARGSVLR